MKKIFLLIVIVFLFSCPSLHSQTKIGLQLGPNFTGASTTAKSFTPEGKINFFGGILAEFKINDMFYIQPEVNFVSKGADFRLLDGAGNTTTSYIYNLFYYYEIPINFLVKFDVGNFTPFLFTGPSFNFFSAAKETYLGGSRNPANNTADLFKKFEFAINFGAGVECSLSNSVDLFITARYFLGLTNIYETFIFTNMIDFEYITLINEPLEKFQTRDISLTAGLKITL